MLHTMDLDVSAGILVPLYDPETRMMFLCGKGDRYIQYVEIADSAPFIIPGLRYTGEQTKGACLVPRRALNVMQAEINRVLQLADNSIVPIMWQVREIVTSQSSAFRILTNQNSELYLFQPIRCPGRAMTGSMLTSSQITEDLYQPWDLNNGYRETIHFQPT